MPGLRPTVDGIDSVLLLNDSIAASELFTAFDPDGDPIAEFIFNDSVGASSGFFIFQGSAVGQGGTITVSADDLDDLIYVAGPVVNDETISIQVSDGTLLSEEATVRIYSARPESVRPIAVVDEVTILSNESVLASSFISSFDPDGFPIIAYTIRDREIDRSFFSLDGEELQQGIFHTVTADEFERLVYNAEGRRSENIDVFAFDGTINSVFTTGVTSVQANLNRPVVQFAAAMTVQDELLPIAPLLSFFDADGNTVEYWEIRDRNERSFSGSLVFRGEDLAPSEFHRFSPDEIDEVFFRGGERNIEEQLRYRASDGRFRSGIRTIALTNVAGGGGGDAGFPVLEADNLDLNVQEQLFFQNVSDLVTQTDGGFPGLTFEVFDTNPDPVSAAFQLDGNQQPGGQILTFTADEFSRLEIRTGTFEARFFDEVYVRTNNGTFNSNWERINIMTEPEHFEAFTRLTPQGAVVATWDDFIFQQGNEPFDITFSFMQQLPDYNTGEAEELPNRMPTPRRFFPFTDAQRQSARTLFNHIETFANVDFIEEVDSPLTVDPVSGNRGGTIRLGSYYRALAQNLGGAPGADNSTACTVVFGPSTAPEGGDVWVNIDGSIFPFFYTNNDGVPAISGCAGLDFFNALDLGPGTFEYRTMLDAVTTAIGQGLPFDLIGGGDQNPILPIDTSTDSFTVQGFDTELNPITGYGLYDVNYFQRIYGPNQNFNSGDTTYSATQNLNFGANSRETIWDGGGVDTLSAEGANNGAPIVDLRPGFFSSIGNLQNNIVIAFRAEIENALGSDLDDQLIGNELNNRIIGGAGNDVIRGNGGDDFLTGGSGGDIYQFTAADGDNRIDEMQLAGRDTIQFDDPFGQFGIDDLATDFRFRLEGRDLFIELTLDGGGQTDTTIQITDQTRGAFRIESLTFGATTVDLVNLTDQIDEGVNTRFQITPEASVFGSLVAPQ